MLNRYKAFYFGLDFLVLMFAWPCFLAFELLYFLVFALAPALLLGRLNFVIFLFPARPFHSSSTNFGSAMPSNRDKNTASPQPELKPSLRPRFKPFLSFACAALGLRKAPWPSLSSKAFLSVCCLQIVNLGSPKCQLPRLPIWGPQIVNLSPPIWASQVVNLGPPDCRL